MNPVSVDIKQMNKWGGQNCRLTKVNIGKFQLPAAFFCPSFNNWLSPQTFCTPANPLQQTATQLFDLLFSFLISQNILLLWGQPFKIGRLNWNFSFGDKKCLLFRHRPPSIVRWEHFPLAMSENPNSRCVFILPGRLGARFCRFNRTVVWSEGEINNPQGAAAKANSFCISRRLDLTPGAEFPVIQWILVEIRVGPVFLFTGWEIMVVAPRLEL